MVNVSKHGILLEKTALPFESKAVLNPACYQDGEFVHMFYRAVSGDNVSSLGYCKLKGPLEIVERLDKPVLIPEHDYEKRGIEDPRLTKIGDTFYLIYTAFDGKNARIAYATSKDLINFEKKGIISANITYNKAEIFFARSELKDRYYFFSAHMQEKYGADILLWEKDGILFPEKINDKFAMIHRILPEMQLIYFDDFEQLKDEKFWEKHLSNLAQYVVVENTEWFENRNIGAGAPPIKTEAGWLLIYHAVRERNIGRIYSVGAILLDLENPLKLVGKLKNPIFSPEEDWEKTGEVKNVVFPSGTSIFKNRLYIYYGAADSQIAVASLELDDFLRELSCSGEKAPA
jgi:predicted GH43/DUF377 family glycosyl hydrolase